MATDIEYALMAGRVYQSTRGEINWLPDLQSLGWTELLLQQKSSGFEAVSFQKGTEIVISFAGTGSNVDWWANAGGFFGVTSDQLRQAADYYLQVKGANPPGTIVSFTGHSLGGGLASLMAVFFGGTATTFDQAPFRNSASVAVGTTLKGYLLNQQGYSEEALQDLTNFINSAADGVIPGEGNVRDFSVQGEILSTASGLRIGTPTSLAHGAPDLTLTVDLHSQALLTAFLQSSQTAPAQHSLRDVSFKLPNVVQMIFDDKLFAFPTSDVKNENFIERIVRHQNGIAGLTTGEAAIAADEMVTRFTKDLWKLAQDSGMTLKDGSSESNWVNRTLIAFAMQKYYDEKSASAGYNKELFTDLDTVSGSGGLSFDMADVADKFATAFKDGKQLTLSDAKGFEQFFNSYLDNNLDIGDANFTAAEDQLILSLLPSLRDGYVQAGANALNATDALNRGDQGTIQIDGNCAPGCNAINDSDWRIAA